MVHTGVRVAYVSLLTAASTLAIGCGGLVAASGSCDPTTDPSCVDAGGSGADGSDGRDARVDDALGDAPRADSMDARDDAPIDAPTPTPGCYGRTCKAAGAPCIVATDCCNLECTAAGVCASASACIADGAPCTASGVACCSRACGSDGTCAALNATCKTAGNPCATNADCCSRLCDPTTSRCSLGASFCTQYGDACARSDDCCGGFCALDAGATLGTCAPPPAGPSICSGVDGVVCGVCTDCCSHVCAPCGTTGISICQPVQGCHIDGELCRKDSDCCGYAGSGLPGEGNVTCDFSGTPPGSVVGVCRNPLDCNPEGNICHWKGPGACGVCSGCRNDCCGVSPGGKADCLPDALGVPRCRARDLPCRAAGETCADSMDCCAGAPCVPDAAGVLRCAAVACEPMDGPCSIDADCCAGELCARATGSVAGTCAAAAPSCALYGQACVKDTDCCGAPYDPCVDASGAPCPGAGHGCICESPGLH